MEIERKWLVKGWPEESMGLTLLKSHEMEQGYLSTAPTVRLRKEAEDGGETEYILCFKSSGGLVREEIELPQRFFWPALDQPFAFNFHIAPRYDFILNCFAMFFVFSI